MCISPGWSMIVFYVIPVLLCLVLISVCYWHIFLEARKQHIQIAAQMSPGMEKGIKAAKVLGIPIVAFILCILPLTFYTAVLGFAQQLHRNEYTLDLVEIILLITALSNAGMNFIIYARKNSNFKEAYKKLLQCKT